MDRQDIYKFLIDSRVGCSGLNVNLYEKYSKETDDMEAIINKIEAFNDYYENNNNRYPNNIMEHLRQREGLDKYDISKDDELSMLTPNEVFKEVCNWNGLLGGYDDTIKSWVKSIYGIDLEEK